MHALFWQFISWLVRRPWVVPLIYNRAIKRPYHHITSADGLDLYMLRWWLFNPYEMGTSGKGKKWAWLPSIRIHYILRPDADRHEHDHPWNARTIILDGRYVEERNGQTFTRLEGYTGTLKFGEYHRIASVGEGGVFTLFITYGHRGDWGFLVDGKKVPWREYHATKDQGVTQ